MTSLTVRRFLVCVLCASAAACGSEAARDGAGGAAGTGGSGGQGGGGGRGDAAAASADAGTADTSPVATMTGPQPPVDCVAQPLHCVSVAGTRAGESLAFSCRMADLGDVTKVGNKWAIHCVDASQDLSFRVTFPAPTAAFDHQVPPSVKDVEFRFASFNLATTARKGEMEEASMNLLRASVTGSVDAEKVVTGSFHGEWGPPSADCRSSSGAPCAQGVVNAGFRVKFF